MKNDIGWSRLLKAIRAERVYFERRKSLIFMIGVTFLTFVLLVGFLRVQLMKVEIPAGVEIATQTVTITPSPTTTRTPTFTITPTKTTTPTPLAVFQNECEKIMATGSDYEKAIGYCWMGKYWIPGLVSYSVSQMSAPDLFYGGAGSYAPGVMEAVANRMGRFYDNYVGAVALEVCGDIGESVWIQRPDHNWEGPFLVIDCARPVSVYAQVVTMGLAIEVDDKTAVRWGAGSLLNVIVSKTPPSQIVGNPISFASWFLAQNPIEGWK